MNLVTRRQWAARPARNRTVLYGSRGLVGHYNGPPLNLVDGCDNGRRCKAVVQATQRFHMDTRGWSDIAYNFLVCPSCGRIYEGRGWGARSAANGTNTGNSWGHAVTVLIGKGEPLTAAARLALLHLGREHNHRYGRQKWRSHGSFKATECPGAAFRRWITDGTAAPPTPEDDEMKTEDFEKIRRIVRQEVDAAYTTTREQITAEVSGVADAVYKRLQPKGGAPLGDEVDLLRQDTRGVRRVLVAIADKVGARIADTDRKPVA